MPDREANQQILDDLLGRRLLFVTGKGGVGKSTVAAALSVAAHGRGMRVLLVDVDSRGDAARLLGGLAPGYEPREAMSGLSFLTLDRQEALDEYVQLALKLRLSRIGPLHKVFDFIATAAPGVSEILVAGKVGYETRATDGGHPRWDLVIVDAAPSGQILSHLRAPRTMTELVGAGMVQTQARIVRDVIENPKTTAMVVVSLLEEMPVVETSELLSEAARQVATPVAALVANRVVSPSTNGSSIRRRQKALSQRAGASVAPAADALDLWNELAARQRPHLERLRSLGPPVAQIPWLALEPPWPRATSAVAAELGH